MYDVSSALILVDLQNDFLPGGALAVPGGDEVVPIANRLIPGFELVVATQDWHPRDHASFAANHSKREVGDVIKVEGLDQVLWPVHCVQQTLGAAFAASLNMDGVHRVFQKGTDARYDSYSGFFDNGHQAATGMGDYLQAAGVQRVIVMGLATDYCVKFTVLDALQLGFETVLIEDGCRGVELNEGDVQTALADMHAAGAQIWNSARVMHG